MALAHRTDVASEAEVADMFQRMLAAFGSIDILIANSAPRPTSTAA